MTDWDHFCEHSIFHTLYLPAEVTATETIICKSDANFSELYPTLAKVLERSRIAALKTAIGIRFLYSWDLQNGGTMHWLCFPPGFSGGNAGKKFHPDHVLLLQYFGGIDEYSISKDPNTQPYDLWLRNLKFALGEDDCHIGLNWNAYYDLIQEWEQFPNPIDERDYLTFAVEANGNRIAYKVSDGRLIMFAADHCFKYVTPFPGCPAQTLYTINGCPNFRDWVETVARQWEAIRTQKPIVSAC